MAKIIVVGGTGLIGSKVVAKLSEHGHEAVACSPRRRPPVSVTTWR